MNTPVFLIPKRTHRMLRHLALTSAAVGACWSACWSPALAGTVPTSSIPAWAKFYDAPANTQVGTYHGKIGCSLAGGLLGSYKLDFELTGAVPVNAGANQPMYVGDGRATITIPAALIGLMKLIGGKQVAGLVTTMNMQALNGTPAVLNGAGATGLVIPPQALPVSGDFRMTVPQDTPLEIGPFTAASGTVSFALGDITTKITLLNAKGKQILPIVAACKAPVPAEYLFDTVFGGPSDLAPLHANTHIEAAQGLPVNAITAATSVGYHCDVDGVGSYDIPVSMSASGVGLVYKTGAPFEFDYGRGIFHVPPQAVNDMLAQTPHATGFRTRVTNLEMLADNALPAIQNAAVDPYISTIEPIHAGQPVNPVFPNNGGAVSPIKFLAGKVGLLHVYLGHADAVIDLFDASNQPIKSLNVSCPAHQPLVPLFPATVIK